MSTLVQQLGDRRWAPTYAEATALRDHIASLLQSDPQRAGRLAADLLRSTQTKGARAAAATPIFAEHRDTVTPRDAPVAAPWTARTEAVAWRARAEAHVYSGELKAARGAYERASALAEAARERGLLGQILVGRIGTLLAMGEFRESQALTRQAEALLHETGDRDYLRRLHINLGSGHYHRERYAEAYASYREALRLMEEGGQRDDLWAALMLNQGIACSQLARVEEARRAFHEAASYGRAHGLDRLVTQAVFNLGALESLRGDYRVAIRYLAEAEDAFTRQDIHELLAATHLEQAQLYLDLSMPSDARELARRAALAFEAEQMLLDCELARMAEARSLRLLDRPSEAAQVLGESERFFRTRRIHPRRAQVLLELAGAQAAQGDLRLAGETARKALRLAERLELPNLKCAARCLRSDLLRRAGKPEEAEAALAGVPPLLSRLPMRDRLSYWSAAARAARGQGNTQAALKRYRRAARCLEAERTLIPGLELRARSFEQGVRIYHEQIALLAGSPRVRLDPVLRLMELARGRTFRELLENGGKKARDEVVEMRAELGSLVKRLDTWTMSGRPAESEEAERLRRHILLLERTITTRIRRLEASNPAAAGTVRLRGADQIAEVLRPREALIEYFVAEDRILAALVTRNTRFLRVLPASASEVRASLDHLRLQLDSFAATASRPVGNIDFLRRSAEARLSNLHRALLRPLLEEVGAPERLTVVPHDLLHQVPFECLHDGERYLDESFEIARCPTADFLVQRRNRKPGRSRPRSVAIAGTRPGSPFIEEEARKVSELWPPGPGALWIDPSPEEALAAMRGASLIHLSAHGSFREDNPLFSTLHLGKGILFLADILETELSADLVVLSACNTGQVFSGRGDALLGVAHAFLAAGSRRLIASLWRVHDGATARWMELFHESVRETRDPTASLRLAGAALRLEWPHPFYWGSFCLVGE